MNILFECVASPRPVLPHRRCVPVIRGIFADGLLLSVALAGAVASRLATLAV